MTVDIAAMPKKIRPVPVKVAVSEAGPVAQAEHRHRIRRDSIRPMKNVNLSSTGTPAAGVLSVFDGEHQPERATEEHDHVHARRGPVVLVATLIQAPSTAGIIDSASSQ